MQAIMVKRSDSGTYEIPGSAEPEDWDEVRSEAWAVDKHEDLMGWGQWQECYRVTLDERWEYYYFVGPDADEAAA